MKAKKQWMSLLGAVMMAAALVLPAAQNVKAADKPVVSVSVGNVTSANVGDVISIPITFSSEKANLVGIHGEATNNYDSSVLEFLGEDDGVDFGNFSGGLPAVVNANFGYVTTKKYDIGSGCVTMKFKVLKCSATPVTVTIKNVYFTSDDFLDSVSTDLTSTITINHDTSKQVVNETPATCTAAGHRTVTCGDCGAVLEDKDLPVIDHTWGEYHYASEADQATCTKEGVQVRTCTVCGATDTETKTVAKVAHSYGDWTVTKEATCTEDGVKSAVCSVCGDTKTEKIPAAHTWKTGDDTDKDGWKVVTEATETKEGSKERECSVCGEKETAVIAKVTPTPTTTPSGKTDSKTDSKTSGTTNKTSNTTSKTSGTSAKSSAKSTGTAVKTGDTFAPILYVALILVAACGITGAVVVKRRKNH